VLKRAVGCTHVGYDIIVLNKNFVCGVHCYKKQYIINNEPCGRSMVLEYRVDLTYNYYAI